jgi:hypothetical protein
MHHRFFPCLPFFSFKPFQDFDKIHAIDQEGMSLHGLPPAIPCRIPKAPYHFQVTSSESPSMA